MSWVERFIYATIIDDRGVRHRVRTSEQSPIGDADIRREFQRALLGSHKWLLLTWIGLMVVIFSFIFWRGPEVGDWVGYLAMALMVFAALLLGWWFDCVRKQSLRRSRLGRGLCAACGYGVRGVPAQDDGLTICPECAVAWRMDHPGTPPSSNAH
jgi:hypothetical protein